MCEVEKIYNKLAIAAAIEKVKQKKISEYTQKFFTRCKDECPSDMANVSLEEFACSTANWNPGKCNIGEQAQCYYMAKNKFPKICPLAKKPSKKVSEKSPLYLSQDAGGSLSVTHSKSNIDGVKSFDAISEDDKCVNLFIFKTVDIGEFSVSEGGGHQDNVRDELKRFISVAKDATLTFNSKPVQILIVVDGRSSKTIIEQCKEALGNSSLIKIGNSEEL